MEDKEKGLEQRYDDYYKEYDLYIRDIMIKTYARQLSKYYDYGLLNNGGSLHQYVNSIGDLFNATYLFSELRNEVEQLLREKYHLVIVSDTPLEIETIKND